MHTLRKKCLITGTSGKLKLKRHYLMFVETIKYTLISCHVQQRFYLCSQLTSVPINFTNIFLNRSVVEKLRNQWLINFSDGQHHLYLIQSLLNLHVCTSSSFQCCIQQLLHQTPLPCQKKLSNFQCRTSLLTCRFCLFDNRRKGTTDTFLKRHNVRFSEFSI